MGLLITLNGFAKEMEKPLTKAKVITVQYQYPMSRSRHGLCVSLTVPDMRLTN